MKHTHFVLHEDILHILFYMRIF